MNRAHDETGAATVLAAILISALATVCTAGIWLGSAIITVHRAQAAADLAALVAAARVPAGTASACAQADALARGMGASLQSCVIVRLDATVVVSIPVRGPISRQARSSAKAGPAVGA